MADSLTQQSIGAARILVVDDDATIRLLCSRTLKEAGYQVLEAEGSPEAMEMVASAKEPIDLLVVDLFLPPPDFQLASGTSKFRRVNGHEMVRQMLELTKELRVLYISSHSKAGLTEQGIALGEAQFLPKPIGKDALLQQVKTALETPPLRHDPSRDEKKNAIEWVD